MAVIFWDRYLWMARKGQQPSAFCQCDSAWRPKWNISFICIGAQANEWNLKRMYVMNITIHFLAHWISFSISTYVLCMGGFALHHTWFSDKPMVYLKLFFFQIKYFIFRFYHCCHIKKYLFPLKSPRSKLQIYLSYIIGCILCYCTVKRGVKREYKCHRPSLRLDSWELS